MEVTCWEANQRKKARNAVGVLMGFAVDLETVRRGSREVRRGSRGVRRGSIGFGECPGLVHALAAFGSEKGPVRRILR
eukprot:2109408-Pyramimonas_sp.AAC.1